MNEKPSLSDVIVEPIANKSATDQPLVARSVSTHVNGQCPVRVLNIANEKLEINKGDYVAQAEVLAPTAIISHGSPTNSISVNTLPEHVSALYQQTCEREQLAADICKELYSLLKSMQISSLVMTMI